MVKQSNIDIEELTRMVINELDTEIKSTYEDAEKYVWQHPGNFEGSPRTVGVEGDGAWFTDIYGKEYFQATSGHSCLNLGYGQQELIDTAKEQLEKLAYFSPAELNIPEIKLAKKLSELFQGDYVSFFSASGSEANEVALKVARQYHFQNGNPNKYKFISHYRGYHGATFGIQNVSQTPVFRSDYPGNLSPGFMHVLPPDDYRCPFGNVEECELSTARHIEEIIKNEQEHTVAGIFVEPVLFAGGCIVPSKKYLEYLREICDKYDILLMVDEVVSGFGKTGKWFGFQHSDDVQPDIITTAKGITSAYFPMGATSISEKIYNAFKHGDRFRHFATMGAHPVGCAVALKNIEIMERDNLVNKVADQSKNILSKLHNLKSLNIVGDVRGEGYLYGIELVEDKQDKTPMNNKTMSEIEDVFNEKGLLVSVDENTIRMNPPLVSTDKDLLFLVDTLTDILKSFSI